MNDEQFKIWAALKILELREALGNANSFFTTTELDMLFNIKEQYQSKIRKQQTGNKIIKLFS